MVECGKLFTLSELPREEWRDSEEWNIIKFDVLWLLLLINLIKSNEYLMFIIYY